MKKNRTIYYFTGFLFIHILVYFFKIDKDVFAFQEYVNQPYQTYTEQPLSKNVLYFSNLISAFSHILKSCTIQKSNAEDISIWNSILLSYNLRVHHLLKLNKSYSEQTINIITVLYRQNIFHQSSEDGDLEFRFLA